MDNWIFLRILYYTNNHMKGIYKITNLKNNKVYIGESLDIKKRWGTHKQHLTKRVHDNKYLQHSWDKYGEKYFYFEVLEEMNTTVTKKELKLKELFYIKEYQSYLKSKGYNISVDTETMIQNMNEQTNYTLKKVCQYSKDGTLIKTWSCVREVVESLNFRNLNKFQTKVYNTHFYKGYYWFYEDTPFYILNNKQKVYQIDKYNGDLIKIWNSITDIVNNLNFSRGKINSVCHKRKKTYKGYVWVYEKDFFNFKFLPEVVTRQNPIQEDKKFINFKTGEVLYKQSIKEAAFHLGFSYCMFTENLNKGYIYKDWGFENCIPKPKVSKFNKALKSIEVKNLLTQEVLNFSSIKKFTLFAKISKPRFSIFRRNKLFPFTYGNWEILKIKE